MKYFQESGDIEDNFFEKIGLPTDEDTENSFVR